MRRCAEVKPKFAFFQEQREGFAINSVVFAQDAFCLIPKILNAVNVVLTVCKFLGMVDAVADKGYDSKENRQHLKEHQLLDGIMHKAHRNRPLTENQTKRNRYLSKTRYVIEQSFGTLHRKFRYARATYFDLFKVSAQSHLKAMCLNLLKAANRLSVPVAA